MRNLFLAKLLVPQRPAVAIKRQSLLARLEVTPVGSVGLLQGPAGYGKTSLLTDLANESRAAICWISLDAWDSDPSLFLDYLDAGVRRALGMDKPRDERQCEDTREALAATINLIASSGRDLDIILDDVHELSPSSATIELIDYLLLRQAPNCRTFLSTRTQLATASWPRLAAGGRTVHLGPDDLLLSDDEIGQLWVAGGNGPLDESVLGKLSAVSRGWPVAVAVAARRGDVRTLEARDQLSDFLVSEIIVKLPGDLRAFVEQCSVLDLITGENCSALLEGAVSPSEADAVIRQLAGINVPATVVSLKPIALRIHPLIRELLQARLRQLDEAAFRSRHRTAAALDLKAHRVSEALSHYAAAESWEELASVIANEAPLAYREGRWHSVTTWLGLLPDEQLLENPGLVIWQARLLVRLGQCDQALALLAGSGRSGPPMSDEVQAASATICAAALRTKGEIGAAVQAGEKGKRLAFESNAPIEIVAEARKELGLSLISQGSFEEGINELRAALEVHQLRGDAADIAFVSGCLGSAYGSVGRLAESVAFLEQARQRFEGLHNSKELGWVLNNLGVAYWWMGSVEKARDVLDACLVVARSGGHRRAEGFALTSLADVDRLAGEMDVGRRRYESVLAISEEVGDVTLGTLALIGLADLERRAGHLQEAEALARRSIASAEARLARSEEALARLTLARLARQSGNSDEALKESAAALSELDAEGVARDLCEALVCRAEVLIDLRSHRSELTSTLRRLDDVINRLGHGSFLLCSERAREILSYAVSRRISDTYRVLMQKLAPAAATASETYPPIEVKALGGFEVTVGGRELATIEWESEKSRELFLLLLVNDRPMTRDEIVANLWPDGERRKATSAFHSTLHRARRALYAKVIVETGGWYSLQPDAQFSSDVGRFRRLAQASSTEDGEDDLGRLSEALEAYGGNFAPNLYSEWVEQTREKLHQRFVDAALRLAHALRAKRQNIQAINVFLRVLETDNLNEDAWCGLLLAEAASGGHPAAARVYKRYEGLLRAELGEGPADRMVFLYRQLREERRAAS